jgi:hypothetical protein
MNYTLSFLPRCDIKSRGGFLKNTLKHPDWNTMVLSTISMRNSEIWSKWLKNTLEYIKYYEFL